MSKLRIVVSWSGGKDSHATLLWVCNKYGAKNVEALFCDTGWEHPITCQHVKDVCGKLGVPLVILKSKKYKDFQDLCVRSHMFPTPLRRTCTEELKTIPLIDWIISQDDNFMVFEGIRAGESQRRAQMDEECMYFKSYFVDEKPKMYKKKAVKAWCATHDASLFRPVFRWTGQQVIDYILANGHQPNPLYRRGASRVGCFPCVMARLGEIKLVARDKSMRERLIALENSVEGKQFFKKNTIPERYCKTLGDGCATVEEVLDYATRDDVTMDMFEEEEGYSCMSLYHGLCE